jgi:hypothetical protein
MRNDLICVCVLLVFLSAPAPDSAADTDSHRSGQNAACDDLVIIPGTIAPAWGTNDGDIGITNISGNGFTGVPIVRLVRPDHIRPEGSINATDVTVVNTNKLTCRFDLTNMLTGWYDLVVEQDDCVVRQPEQFLIVGMPTSSSGFANGSFELPIAPLDCGPPPSPVPGAPTGWSYEGTLFRDCGYFAPTCSNQRDGGHYASMLGEAGETARAYQTFFTIPLTPVYFSGEFAWGAEGGDAIVRIALIDGTIRSGIIDPNEVISETHISAGDWQYAEILGSASGHVMTAVWEATSLGGEFGAHADGLRTTKDCHPCRPLFADSDDDGDVDQDDFGLFQRCMGPEVILYPPCSLEPLSYCICFDRNLDRQIDQRDFAAFEACASGPDVPADPACDD